MIEEIRYTPSGAPLVNEVGADLALLVNHCALLYFNLQPQLDNALPARAASLPPLDAC
jgi:hypothetical protein